ncbi:MAG: hypothetical protein ACR2JG_09950 [Geodermatophilaceae bacterium]
MIADVLRRSRLVAGLAAALTALAACSAGSGSAVANSAGSAQSPAEPTAPVATPAVPGVEATAVRLRTDVAIGGQFQTRIVNTGSEPFVVLAVSLDSPGFERLPFAGRPATYAPGQTIDLPTLYGPAVCDEGIGVDPAFTAAQLQHADGAVEEVRVPLQAPDDIIDRIHRERCHAQRLAAAVGVSLGDFTSVEVDGRTVVQTTLTLTRGTSTEDISVSELRGSVVFDVVLAEEGEPPTMPAAENQLDVPLIIRHTARGCDAHVLGETKQPFLFPFFLTFASGDPQFGTFDVSPVQREVLWEYIQTVCPDG